MSIEKILIFALCLGLILLFSESFIYAIKEFIYSHKSTDIKEKSKIETHMLKVLTPITKDREIEKVLHNFYVMTICSGAIALVLTINVFGIRSIIFGLIFAAVPYIFYRVKLAIAQRNSSFDGELVVKELRNQYSYNYKNMIFALDSTIYALSDEQQFTKRVLTRLSMRLKTYKTEEELREILEDFRFAFNTHWAKMLTQNIYASIKDHLDVSAGLDNLLILCQEISSRLEEEKQSTAQVASMNMFLAPALLVIFYFLALRMVSFEKLIEIQFTTEIGLLMFFAIIGIVIANIIAGMLLKHPKYDL